MAKKISKRSKSESKEYAKVADLIKAFKAGEQPKGQDFADLINSAVLRQSDKIIDTTLEGVVLSDGSDELYPTFDVGDDVKQNSQFLPNDYGDITEILGISERWGIATGTKNDNLMLVYKNKKNKYEPAIVIQKNDNGVQVNDNDDNDANLKNGKHPVGNSNLFTFFLNGVVLPSIMFVESQEHGTLHFRAFQSKNETK